MALPGYGWETAETVSAAVARMLALSGGATEEAIRDIAAREWAKNPFAASAVITAIEMPRYLRTGATRDFPLNAPVSGEIPVDRFREQVQRALDSGFQFIKVKVGKELTANIEAAHCVLTEFPDSPFGVLFDANQGFSLDAALKFARTLAECSSPRLLWFEQPVDRTAWNDMETLCRTAPVPVLLDECIYDQLDIARAAAIGAFGVKLKLFKNFGIAGTLELARQAQDASLAVVFGNGVATDIGNLGEYLALAAAPKVFAPPAEANGFLKLRSPLLDVLDGGARGGLLCKTDSGGLQNCIRRFVAQAQIGEAVDFVQV